jgi:hypothetical protein
MSFSSILRDDAVKVFGDAVGGFAETVTLTPPPGSGLAARAFTAQVFYHVPEDIAGTDKAAPKTEVFVPYSEDPTEGATAIVLGGTTVTVPERQGGTPRARPIAQIMTQDAGGWLLRLT